MKYKAVLFDLDGTLLDTLEDIAASANNILKQNGYPFHETYRYKEFVGDGMETLVKRILPENKKVDSIVRNILMEIREEYSKNWMNNTKPFPGIPELLEELQKKEIKLSILSNKPHDFTTDHVKHYFSTQKFDAVFGIRDGIPKKPDPAGALEISQIISIPAEEFIYVGDTNTDMKTAIAAGMYPIGVLWGFRDEDELIKSGAKKIIDSPEELLEFF